MEKSGKQRRNLLRRSLSSSAITVNAPSEYSHTTLVSDALTVNVFLPTRDDSRNTDQQQQQQQQKSSSKAFYASTRFEHGSMIGPVGFGGRELYGAGLWRSHFKAGPSGLGQPTSGAEPFHDPTWPESGVGLASEFGCGEDGAVCSAPSPASGWDPKALREQPGCVSGNGGGGSPSSSSSSRSEGDCAPTISNGVLGYESALPGEPFLKIGVGALLKGSCPACTENWGSADPYHFNSPYAFARDHGWLQDNATLSTEWAVLSPSSKAEEAKRVVVMEQTVVLDPSKKKGQGRVRSGSSSSSGSTGSKLGYRLRKTVRVEGSVLTVTSELTNLGEQPFTTPFYSHHLFSVDGIAIGKGYTAVLQGLPPTSSFAEPGVALNQTTGKFDAGWAAPLKSVATVTGGGTVTMAREPSLLPDGSSEKVKAEFQLGGGADPISNAFSLSYAPSGGGASSGVAVSEEVLGSGHLPFSTRRNDPPPELLAYNIYIERGTLSPEPVFLVGPLGAGGSATWVQRLTFSQSPAGGAAPDSNQGQLSTDKAQEVAKEGASERLLPAAGAQRSLLPLFFLLVACGAAVAAASYLTRYLAPQRRKAYVTIPETPRIAETELRESPQRQR